MNKEEAQELQKQVEKSKLAEAGMTETPKEQPLGMDFIQGGYVKLPKQTFYSLLSILRPFQTVARLLDDAHQNAVREGMIIPFYKKDTKSEIKDAQGNLIGYELVDTFGAPERKTNEVTLLDVQGNDLKTEKQAKSN